MLILNFFLSILILNEMTVNKIFNLSENGYFNVVFTFNFLSNHFSMPFTNIRLRTVKVDLH